MWFGRIAVVGVVAAMVVSMAPADALPHEDRAVLSASVATSAAAPRIIVPGGPETTIVVTNIGRTRTTALRARLAKGPGGQAFQISYDSCTLRRLGPRRKCAVRVGYASSVRPEAAATAVLRVVARGKRKVATTSYFAVAARTRYAPVAVGDVYSMARDGSLSAGAPGVLANDSDPDRSQLTASLIEGVKHGTLTLGPDGSFGYQPEAGYAGPDSFTYRATDTDGLSAVAVVSIDVVAPG